MFLVGMLRWWYGDGWWAHARASFLGVLKTADTFSIGLLARTLFDPFRQISAGSVRGSLAVRWRAFTDRLFSRVFGAFLRSVLIAIGLLAIAVRGVWSALSIIIWSSIPLMPFAGLLLCLLRIGV